MNASDGRAALDHLYWRTEILQALYWLHGEGLADSLGVARLAEFLAADPRTVAEQTARLVQDGYLEAVSPQPAGTTEVAFRLSPLGLREGARSFRDEFEGLTRQAHFACSPGCWCHDPKQADAPCPSTPIRESEP
jgi:hypothetical protein